MTAITATTGRVTTRHLARKWTVRGNYVDLGRGGAVYRTHFDLRDVKADLTEPHNKHSKIARALLETASDHSAI